MSVDLLFISNMTNHPKKFSHVQPMSDQAARAEAGRLLQLGLSVHLERALTLLYSAGVLPAYRLPVDERTLRKYHHLRLLDRLPYLSREIQEAYQSYDLPVPSGSLLLYTLGPVGREIVKERFGHPAPGGYLNMPLTRLMHDLAVNELIFRLADLARGNAAFRWMSKYEATLWKDGQPVLEPDALFFVQRGEVQEAYLLEYHNEQDRRSRAEDKILQYQKALQSNLWSQQWEVETFPPVLVVYRDASVAKGYHESLRAYPSQIRFYGASLQRVFGEAWREWFDLQNRQVGQKTTLFTW